jgi:hypothetical protein
MGREPSRRKPPPTLPARLLRAAARVTLAAAVALLVGIPPSGWADARHPDHAGNLPTLSTAGADAVALARPPGAGGPVGIDLPAGLVAAPDMHVDRVHGERHPTCSRETHGRAHARGPPAG